MQFENSRTFAQQLDAKDPLAKYRNEFIFPKINDKDAIYFTGNSLGNLAVEGHFQAEKPWWDYHERFADQLSKVVGAKPKEVTVMNTLTVNLHLMMVSFYRPTKKRYKIICEEM